MGCNVGVEYSDSEADIFLLNNDTRLAHNSLFWLRMGLYENGKTDILRLINGFAGEFFGGRIDHNEKYNADNGLDHTDRGCIGEVQQLQTISVDVHIKHFHGCTIGDIGEEIEMAIMARPKQKAVTFSEKGDLKYGS